MNSYMTCSGRNDGIGAQLHGVLSAMLFCHEMGLSYVHTPFKEIAHNHTQSPEWEKDWNVFFNLGSKELQLTDIKRLNLKYNNIPDPGIWKKASNSLSIVPHCHFFTDKIPDQYHQLKEGYLQKYYAYPKTQYNLLPIDDRISLAVHIRRGDVSLEKYPNRYTTNERIGQLISRIRNVLKERNLGLTVNIFSQGNPDDFEELKGEDVIFHLDQCLFSTFHSMVCADMLITGKSSFSYTAGLYSEGLIFYEPFWHKPQKHWLVNHPDTLFDPQPLKEYLMTKIATLTR